MMIKPEAGGPQQSPGDEEMSPTLVFDPINVCFSCNMRSDMTWENFKQPKRERSKTPGHRDTGT